MDYSILPGPHRLTVAISLALFVLRGVWRMLDSPMNDRAWVKIVPHVNDTLLLLAAIGMLIVALADFSSGNLAFTARLLQDLTLGSTPPTNPETAHLLASLFRHKQYDLAYRTFLLTLTPQEKDLSGFVFNGQFRQGPSGRRFDWMIRQQPGIVLTLPAGSADSASGQGLLLEFGGTPVLRIGLEQNLLLPPGAYQLEFSASATGAELPKSLLWAIDCIDPGQPVQRVEVPDGTYQNRTVRGAFTVPQNCPVQNLTLRTNAMVESWSSRYSGRVLFHSIRISAVQS